MRVEAPSAVDAGTEVAIMVTRRCNMACGHCSVESGPQVRGEPSEAVLLEYVRQAARAGVRAIRVTGGEPMIRPRAVVRLLRECRRLGVRTSMATNGFWGREPRAARRHLRALRRAGLHALTVSYDRYHAAFQGVEPVLHIAQAAAEVAFPLNINVTRAAADAELAPIIERFRRLPWVHLRLYDVQPVGRARVLPGPSLRSEVEGFCAACAVPAVTDDGRVIACNGPAYFAGPESPLSIGSLHEHTMAELLDRHRADPVLDTIRTFGPAGLRDALRRSPGFESFAFRPRYFGICDLCHHITSDAGAVAALRASLSEPPRQAVRRAAGRVIDAGRREGALGWHHVNGAGAAGIFLEAAVAADGRWPAGAERILGRADLDWSHWAEYLGACGLARPLLAALEAPELARWAPTFFTERLRALGVRDGLATLVRREAIRRIEDALRGLRARGVVLKGTALMLRDAEARPPRTARGTGDVDIYVEPPAAHLLRARLLAAGFEGTPGAEPEAPHHLAPITYQGMLVEIHTRLVAPFWGLPEREMLARAEPVEGAASLRTLSAEGIALHALVHTAQDSFSHGLKTAWDLLWVLRTSPDVDWDRLASWIGAARAPRGIWASLRVLARDLALAIPATVLARAPVDDRQRRLEVVARRRLFSVAERPEDLDPLSRQGIRLLMHGSWLGFARYLACQIAWRCGRPVAWRGTVRRATHTPSARAALAHWRQYRRALRES